MHYTLFRKQPHLCRRIWRMKTTIVCHLRWIWLFNFSDLKTIVVPSTIFGLTNAAAATQFGFDRPPIAVELLHRTIPTLFWVYLNLLPFAINNQRTPAAIMEDSINKPWRPLPSREMSPSLAKIWMILFYTCAILYSASVSGALAQSASLLLLGIWYNNLKGADMNPIIRNVINAFGYICFTSGALEIASGNRVVPFQSTILMVWLGIVAAIIFTTVHLQDMYDQEGDSARGRRTMPLVIGDPVARWTIFIFMQIWGIACPAFWDAPLLVWTLSVSLAEIVGFRTLQLRSVAEDKRTFVVWNVWMATVYALPLTASRQPTFS